MPCEHHWSVKHLLSENTIYCEKCQMSFRPKGEHVVHFISRLLSALYIFVFYAFTTLNDQRVQTYLLWIALGAAGSLAIYILGYAIQRRLIQHRHTVSWWIDD